MHFVLMQFRPPFLMATTFGSSEIYSQEGSIMTTSRGVVLAIHSQGDIWYMPGLVFITLYLNAIFKFAVS